MDLRARARVRARRLRPPHHGERGRPRGLRGAVPEDGRLAVQVRGVPLQYEDVQNVQGDQEDAASLLQVRCPIEVTSLSETRCIMSN